MKILAIVLLAAVLATPAMAVPVRVVTVGPDALTLLTLVNSQGVTQTLTAAQVPSASKVSMAAVEVWVNSTWAPVHMTDYQLVVHVTLLSPLRVAVFTANLGAAIPANWWLV